MNRRSKTALLSCLALIACTALPAMATDVVDLGSIDFPNSGSKQAQGAFYRGVLLLHSFEFEDAREEFQAAQEIDPDFGSGLLGRGDDPQPSPLASTGFRSRTRRPRETCTGR